MALLCSSGGGVDEHAAALLADLHRGTWFRCRDSTKVILTSKGGRQGCKVGSLVFNSIYTIALKEVRKQLIELGVVLVVKDSHAPFWQEGDPPP